MLQFVKYLIAFGIGTVMLASCGTYEAQQSLPITERTTFGAEGSLSPFNHTPQQYAGMTAARIIMVQGKPVVIEFLSGKEAKAASISFKSKEGATVTYNVKELAAFTGQTTRGDVEKALAEANTELWTNLAPEIRNGIIDAVCVVALNAACPTSVF